MTEKKENFFKKAFKEMIESAKAEHSVDKANFEAIKAESKANFEENRGRNSFKKAKETAKASWDNAKLSPRERQELMQKERQDHQRKAEAETRYSTAKNKRQK